MKSFSRFISALFPNFFAVLLLLPGCAQQIEDKKEESRKETVEQTASQDLALASVDGKTLMTAEDFQFFLDRAEDAQPGIKQKLQEQPQLEEQVFNTLIDQKIIEHWIDASGIGKTQEYQDSKKQCIEFCTLQLAYQKFEDSVLNDYQANDADVRKFYEQNKKQYIKKRGGVKAQEVTFSNEKTANEFLAKAKAAPKNFESLAKEAGKTVIDLGTVTKENKALDEAITSKLSKVIKVPSIDLVKIGNEFHIINSTKKLDDEYENFDDVKGIVKQMLDFEIIPQKIQEKIQNLRKEYGLKINKTFSATQEKSKKTDDATRSKEDPAAYTFPQSA